jgi:hypothetical protein
VIKANGNTTSVCCLEGVKGSWVNFGQINEIFEDEIGKENSKFVENNFFIYFLFYV